MSRKSYSKEFKSSAVRLMVMEGLSASAVSQKLGVSESLLYKWKHQQVNAMATSEADMDPQALVAENEQLRKQLAQAEKINDILKKNSGVLCGESIMKYRAIKTQAPAQEIDLWCRVLNVSRSAYYNWLGAPLRKRFLQDEVIKNGFVVRITFLIRSLPFLAL